jgi:hypothetical protein
VPVAKNRDSENKDGDDYKAEGFKLTLRFAGTRHGIILSADGFLCDLCVFAV